MHIATLTLGPFETNCYLVWNDVLETLVIDPASDAGKILAFIDDNRLNVKAYPLTHGHVDHVSALAEVHGLHEAPVGLHPLDASWAFTPRNQLLPHYDTPRPPRSVERTLAEAQEWKDAGLRYRVLETPGHTPGSVSFYFEEERAIFSGDVLFQGGVGRTDLPGGDASELTRSMKRLAALPDDVTVYPGHGPVTTIGREKQSNPFMRGL